MKKLVIVGLISAAIPLLSANAAEIKHYAIVDTLAEQPFVKDTKLTLSYKNFWKYLKEEESTNKKVHAGWGHAIGLDYKSGYFLDFIGVDATYTGAMRLGNSDNFASRAVLYNDNGKAKGYSKLGQRYVKVKLGNDTVKFNGKAGYQILKNYGTITASTRLSQNSYLGYSGTTKFDNFTVDAAYVTSSINRDSPNKVGFKSNDNSFDIDYIYTGGLTYKDKTMSLSYGYGYADDYMRRHVIELSYKPMQELTLASQIYGSYALDNYKRMSSGKKEFDEHAWHYAADAKWLEKDWSMKFGIAYTQADLDNKIGIYGRHMGKNTRGRFNAMTSAGKDYMRDGELALTWLGNYNFIEELTSGIQLNYGQFDYKDNTVRTGEITLINRWVPADPRLKNLSVFSMFGYGWSYKNSSNTPTLDHNGRYQRAHSLSGEIVIDYKFSIL